jgi:hypothetical protein
VAALTTADAIRREFRLVWERLLETVEPLTDEQFAWRPGPGAPTITFHVWHAARWTDWHLETLRDPGTQIWERERLAEAWSLSGDLGFDDTGMGLEACDLPLSQHAVLDYARRVFHEAWAAIAAMDSAQMDAPYTGHRRDVIVRRGEVPTHGALVLTQLVHLNRHLGMIEALKGAQGLLGTATQ